MTKPGGRMPPGGSGTEGQDKSKHCHGQTRNLQCAQADSGTTDRVVFSGLVIQ